MVVYTFWSLISLCSCQRQVDEVAKAAALAEEKASASKTPLHPRPAWAENMDNKQSNVVRVDLSTLKPAKPLDEHDCSMYRLSLEVDSPTSVNVRYCYPPGNAAIRNAWIGLFRRTSLVWMEEYGVVDGGQTKVAWKMIKSNGRAGVLRFGKLPKDIADDEYIFTLQIDYGVECRAASETITASATLPSQKSTAMPLAEVAFC